jgi:hypothetical protein
MGAVLLLLLLLYPSLLSLYKSCVAAAVFLYPSLLLLYKSCVAAAGAFVS